MVGRKQAVQILRQLVLGAPGGVLASLPRHRQLSPALSRVCARRWGTGAVLWPLPSEAGQAAGRVVGGRGLRAERGACLGGEGPLVGPGALHRAPGSSHSHGFPDAPATEGPAWEPSSCGEGHGLCSCVLCSSVRMEQGQETGRVEPSPRSSVPEIPGPSSGSRLLLCPLICSQPDLCLWTQTGPLSCRPSSLSPSTSWGTRLEVTRVPCRLCYDCPLQTPSCPLCPRASWRGGRKDPGGSELLRRSAPWPLPPGPGPAASRPRPRGPQQ